MTPSISTSTTSGLRATNIVAGYRADNPVLHNVDLVVEPGQRVSIIGRSGSGKSTLLKVLLAQLAPFSGQVTYQGNPVKPGPVASLRDYRRHVQYIPQDPASSLDPRMTVRQLILEPLRQLKVPGDHEAAMSRALEQVQLGPEFLARRRHQLSGGQAQRVAIARALATGATTILADEPVSGLDLPLRNEVLSAFAGLEGVSIVLVTHDLDAAKFLCDHAIVLHQGRVVERAPTSQIVSDPQHDETVRLVSAMPRI
ncbi:ABC transporter ATP-binding protein [Corynebacterium cystitidis]|uniref:ABC transporter ATP-binding protein n=1 Tax=Corynebacterium cystitidis TaxID=35757 RepID=UPI00211EC02B|nr:dipeptide/oligopeptide/nickel ABC transporter ATP-binding protein [Corynebacterium cystitidis]